MEGDARQRLAPTAGGKETQSSVSLRLGNRGGVDQPGTSGAGLRLTLDDGVNEHAMCDVNEQCLINLITLYLVTA